MARPARAPGTHTHDGLYLRFHIGYGYGSLSTTSGGYTVAYTGTGGYGNFALGGALTESFILYGSLSANGIPIAGGTVNVGGIGVGAAYYVEPANVYIAATIAAASIWVTPDGGTSTVVSDGGYTVEGVVGKEWWVSANWALGVGGQGMFGRADVKGDPTARWSAWATSMLFSATFN